MTDEITLTNDNLTEEEFAILIDDEVKRLHPSAVRRRHFKTGKLYWWVDKDTIDDSHKIIKPSTQTKGN